MRIRIIISLCICLLGCRYSPSEKKPSSANSIADSSINTTPTGNREAIIIRKEKKHIPQISAKTMHPRARLYLKDSFYFNSNDETAPFGNTTGKKAWEDFYEWRQLNNGKPVITFLKNKIESADFSGENPEDPAPAPLQAFLMQHEYGSRMLYETDALVIAISFAQLYLEGRIDSDVKAMAIAAIKRESSALLLVNWGEPVATERKKKLELMLHNMETMKD
ncbi:MAG: hypothetical protein JST81_05785 [Bacteroidetes bacterium]|nr:hypothetical protein [Bacteroidota bacterium]